ncbi:MAG: DUF1573 domain-containing protein, partial [Bacteroidetes bacterium]|nr:DUF1573 domain-containing protein [Bacteroidota bacterium]
FGTITKGEIVSHTFKFTNTGNNPLVIHKAKASCGCTIPKYSKEPIAPGDQGEIAVTFESDRAGGLGWQNKNITITANTKPISTKLLIKAKLIAKQ